MIGNSEGRHRGDGAGTGKIPRRRGKIRFTIAKQEPNLLELIFVAGLSGIFTSFGRSLESTPAARLMQVHQ